MPLAPVVRVDLLETIVLLLILAPVVRVDLLEINILVLLAPLATMDLLEINILVPLVAPVAKMDLLKTNMLILLRSVVKMNLFALHLEAPQYLFQFSKKFRICTAQKSRTVDNYIQSNYRHTSLEILGEHDSARLPPGGSGACSSRKF